MENATKFIKVLKVKVQKLKTKENATKFIEMVQFKVHELKNTESVMEFIKVAYLKVHELKSLIPYFGIISLFMSAFSELKDIFKFVMNLIVLTIKGEEFSNKILKMKERARRFVWEKFAWSLLPLITLPFLPILEKLFIDSGYDSLLPVYSLVENMVIGGVYIDIFIIVSFIIFFKYWEILSLESKKYLLMQKSRVLRTMHVNGYASTL